MKVHLLAETVTLPKPRFGKPCNGCGLCCSTERCGLAVQILGAGPGPCPALEWQEGRSWCGLLRNPRRHLPSIALLFVRGDEIGKFQCELASALAISSGCDSDDDCVVPPWTLEAA